MEEFDKNHCWQYEMKLRTIKEDMKEKDLTEEYISNLRVKDFEFSPASKEELSEIREFIVKYEWLGTLPPYPTHYFKATHEGMLGAVVIFSMPNAFSNILGKETKELERLLARGASASWTPKNLASSFVTWSIDYMAKNTQYKVFTAYSDPTAKELGTIYQACNFMYLGNNYGASKRYREPNSDKWVSDRKFRNTSSYKKYAKENGIEWQDNWSDKRKMKWENIPKNIEEFLKNEGKRRKSISESKEFPLKHKYCMIKGKDKRETKKLLKKFYKINGNKDFYNYPQIRGN